LPTFPLPPASLLHCPVAVQGERAERGEGPQGEREGGREREGRKRERHRVLYIYIYIYIYIFIK
jgi:hypothetical protein